MPIKRIPDERYFTRMWASMTAADCYLNALANEVLNLQRQARQMESLEDVPSQEPSSVVTLGGCSCGREASDSEPPEEGAGSAARVVEVPVSVKVDPPVPLDVVFNLSGNRGDDITIGGRVLPEHLRARREDYLLGLAVTLFSGFNITDEERGAIFQAILEGGLDCWAKERCLGHPHDRFVAVRKDDAGNRSGLADLPGVEDLGGEPVEHRVQWVKSIRCIGVSPAEVGLKLVLFALRFRKQVLRDEAGNRSFNIEDLITELEQEIKDLGVEIVIGLPAQGCDDLACGDQGGLLVTPGSGDGLCGGEKRVGGCHSSSSVCGGCAHRRAQGCCKSQPTEEDINQEETTNEASC